tara:strand:- start:9305 stop:10276 length:972 start_codon:yes stop_codon:yes gene_type:complete
MSEKIVITGGSGFIGSALVKRLVNLGHKVTIIDNNSRGNVNRLEGYLDKIEYIKGDIRDKDFVSRAMVDSNTIFHLAFINGTKFFYEQPKLVLDVGVKGIINTLEAVELGNVSTYILASSSEVYQEPINIPTDEKERCVITDTYNPRFSYAGGKLISELLAINFFRNSAVRDIIFRPHNIFGPDMGFEHVIPEIIKKLYYASDRWKKNKVDLEIQGTGMETRAFCYIEDAIDQIIVLYNKGKKGETYHIGIDNEITISDLINKISEFLKLEVNIKQGKLKSGGTNRRCPDISKIKKLNYNRKDRFVEGLKETVFWYRDNFTNS